MPYLKIATYLAAMALGASICYWVYATPRVDELKAQIAHIQAADAEAEAKFRADAAIQEKEKQDAVDAANQRYVESQKKLGQVSLAAAATDKRLRDYISSSVANLGPKLSTTPEGAISNATAAAGWVLAGQLDNYASECAAEADRLGNEVRRLEASYGAP